MNSILPLLFVAVFAVNNTIPSVGCQKVLDPVRKERDSKCDVTSLPDLPYIAFSFNSEPSNGEFDASYFTVAFNKYCTDKCLQARIKYNNMFGNNACKDDVFDFSGIDVAGPVYAKVPELKNSGNCRKVNNQYCAATEWSELLYFDRYTTQNKTHLCTDCMKDYFSKPNEFRMIDSFSPEIAANSTKALNNYEKVCDPVNKKSSAHGMNIWTVHLAVLLMYLGL
ncbi:hypothetical protein BC833DRAFT_638478 [Globomyces pollinis-pini]|nr:hypothetical protein BC833DRAFT_638478 [Globomyces pollinis-pini]